MPVFFILIPNSPRRLNKAKLGGGDVEGIDVSGQAGKGLLGAIGAIVLVSERRL
jgi:hypothetical protein